jgi:hypothetical protein
MAINDIYFYHGTCWDISMDIVYRCIQCNGLVQVEVLRHGTQSGSVLQTVGPKPSRAATIRSKKKRAFGGWIEKKNSLETIATSQFL